jgi:hypothetical protein
LPYVKSGCWILLYMDWWHLDNSIDIPTISMNDAHCSNIPIAMCVTAVRRARRSAYRKAATVTTSTHENISQMCVRISRDNGTHIQSSTEKAQGIAKDSSTQRHRMVPCRSTANCPEACLSQRSLVKSSMAKSIGCVVVHHKERPRRLRSELRAHSQHW